MINIDDYNFESGITKCYECPFEIDCSNGDSEFETIIENNLGMSDFPACRRFKITKKIKDETSNN